MTTIGLSPGDKVRLFCTQHGLTQQERDYLLGVLGEAVVVEREACAKVADGTAAEARLWNDDRDPEFAVPIAETIAAQIRNRGQT